MVMMDFKRTKMNFKNRNSKSTKTEVAILRIPKQSDNVLYKGLYWMLIFLLMAGLQLVSAQSFDKSDLDFNTFSGVNNATSLEFGPDSKLYVAEENGLVKIYTIQRNGPQDYDVTGVEVLTLVQSIPNHNDDGNLGGPTNRQVTGITVAGTASNPIVYVSSSDRRRGAGGGGGDVDLDTNSGVITRLMKNGVGIWQAVDMVRGLPRSEENHATNGMQHITIAGKNWLIVSSGGFTNAGAPSNNFAYITEYALAAAVLAIDLDALDALPVLNDGSRDYIYDVPTLDDPTRPNANGIESPDSPGYDGVDINDPWGGNDGLNMGMLVAGSPVKMFSPGYRNSYDNIITEDGHVYVTDNGANGGWGGFPEYEGDATLVNNNYRSGEPGSTGADQAPNATPFDAKVNNSDHLNLVTTNIDSYVFGSIYGGHPCPVRANINAGLFTRGTHSAGGAGQSFSDSYFRTKIYDPDGSTPNSETDPTKALPANWPPVDASLINPENADYRQPTLTAGANPDGPDDIIVVNWSNNTNAIAEYTASNFGGVMKGDLIAGKGNALHRVDRDASGAIVGFEESKFTGISGNALGVDAQGDNEIFPGTIWVANFNGDDIVILEPNDFVNCVLPGEPGYDPNGDNDADGYTNNDEVLNDTDPCSGSSQPNDFDGDLVSDLLDVDDDDDGINDNLDPLQMGQPFDLPVENELFLGTDLGGYLGLGFTGLMNNGTPNPNYLNWQDDPSASTADEDDILGGAIGAVTMFQTTGNANSNDQEKAYQYGINVDNTSNTFTVHGRMLPPFHNFSITESQGMFIGDGFQDNYLKLVLGQNYELSIVGENNESQVTYLTPEPIGFDPLTVTSLDLFLEIDPSVGSVQAKYKINDGAIIDLGLPYTAQGGTLTSIQSAEPLMVGIIGNADVDDNFSASWDFLNALGSEPFVSQEISDLERFVNANAEVIGLESYFNDDGGSENLTFTVQSNTNSLIGASISGSNLTLTFPSSSETATITIRATDTDGMFVDENFLVNVVDSLTALYRVNSNGPQYTDENGDVWEADDYFNGGNTSSKLGQAIANTTDDALYQTERFGNFEYAFPVANGDYTVELHFAEIFFGLPGGGSNGGVGSRVFNVNIEGGQEELTGFDIFSEIGTAAALTKTFTTSVTDGFLNIDFIKIPNKNNAQISAIAIFGLQSNNPPIIIETIENQTNNLGETPVLSVVATGGDANETFDFQATGLPPGLTIENTNGSILGTITTSVGAVSSYPVTITVSKPSSIPENTSFIWNITDPNALNPVLFRVNAGGPLTASNDGFTMSWDEDQKSAAAGNPNGNASNGTPSQYVNFQTQDATFGANLPASFVNNTGYPDALFATERFNTSAVPNNMQWSFPTGNGNFQVNLLFNENWGSENTQPQNNRIFDVEIEGQIVLDDYRPSVDGTQPNVARLETFQIIVNDGVLNIDLIKISQNPAIKGIEIKAIGNSVSEGPLVTNPGAQVGVEGDVVNLQILASDGSDPSCGPLTYAAENLPENLTINENTGLISGTLKQGTGSGTSGAFIESNGLVVIEMESTENLPGSWVNSTDSTSPNISNPASATGGDFIVWEGGQFFNQQGNGLITYPIEITTTGTYEFKWRTQVGNGTSSTDHNDTWLKIEADSFYGQKSSNGTIVCPKGANGNTNDCVGNLPKGSGGNGWFKVYSSGATNWTWSTFTNDNDGHKIYARFDNPGTYNILISARSSGHALDRMVLVHADANSNGESLTLLESEQAVGQVAGAADDSPYNVTVTVTDACDPSIDTNIDFTWNVTKTAVGNPSATVDVIPGGGIGASTFGNNSFIINNTGDDDIVNVTINTTTGFMKDVVFDPVGTAGDSTAKCLTAGINGGGPVGLTVGANGNGQDDCVDIFTQFHNGIDDQEGYDIMSLDFTDFNPGEAFNFGVDMDPTTIKGDLTAGDAGSISGFELIGATISVEFASGVVFTSSLFDEGSIGGSDVTLNGSGNALVAPSILVEGLSVDRVVSVPNQIVEVSGPPNASVTLLRIDGRLYIDPGNPSVGYDIDSFEANDAMAKQLYAVQLDATGKANIPVVLTQTPGPNGTPDGGLNHFIAVVNGQNGENSIASNVIVLEFDPDAVVGPSVLVEMTPGADLDTSTFGGGSFQISNNSTGGLQITNLTIDLSTAILPDMVFDPVGSGGDATAKCFVSNLGAAAVGLVVPNDPCISPFSQPRNGGFDVMSINFTEFDPGEFFTFAVDVDPNSIQGVSGAGSAGSVSGYELIGSTVTLTFSDNSILTTSIYEDGSLGGGQAIATAETLVAPTISVMGVTGSSATVNDLNQTITVSGTPGDVVSLMLMDSRLYIAQGGTPFNVPDPTYYANEAMDKSLYTGLIGAGGSVDIPVELLVTQFGNGTPDGGLNQIVAVTTKGAYAPDKEVSTTSNIITLLYDPNAVDTGDVTVTYSLQGRTDQTIALTVNVYEPGVAAPVYQFTPTGNATGEFTIAGLDVGNYNIGIKASNYLQRVSNLTVVSGANTLTVNELKAGDANDDNFVTLQDFSILASSFNLQSGGTGFDERADFNGDGFVTLLDFSLQSSNFNTQGEEIP